MSKLEMSQTIGEILRSQEFQEYQEQPENQYHKINAQQMMKTPVFFDCIVAPDGYSFVELDFTSLEPSIMAEFSQDPTYIELFASGKPHCVYLYVACKLLDPDGKITQVYQPDSPVPNVAEAKKLFKSERSIAKVVHLMSAYKAGAPAIQRKINITGGDISKEQAYDLRERYWGPELFGGVLEYEQHLLHEVKQRGGWLVNGLGRPLVVTEKKAKDVLNTVCQATGHDCLDIYVNKLEPLIISSGIPAVPIIPDWHDETVWMCPTSDAPRLAEIFIQAMHETNKELGFGIPLRGEPEITKTFTQFKNPDPSTDNWYENKLEKLK